MSSTLDSIMNAVVTDVQGLNLTLGSTAATVVKRKGVKDNPGGDQSFQITVCMSDKEEEQVYLGFGLPAIYYYIQIAVVSPNNRDWATNLPTYAQWRESIRTTFLPPALFHRTVWVVPGVFVVLVQPKDFLDRERMSNLYDEQSIYLKVGATT